MSSDKENLNDNKESVYAILFIIIPIIFIIADRPMSSLPFSIRLGMIIAYFLSMQKVLKQKGIKSIEKSFKIDLSSKQEILQQIVSLGSLLIILLSTLLYVDRFGFINFGQYFFTILLMSTILIKLFGEEELENKYRTNLVKWSMIANITVLLFLAPFLFIDAISKTNFIQHQLIYSLSLIVLYFIAKEDLLEFISKNTRNKIILIDAIILFVSIDLVILTISNNNESNFLQFAILAFENAATLILISAGLTLTTRVRKFGNFAHAEYVTIGIYVALFLKLQELPISGNSVQLGFLNNIFGQMLMAFVFTGFIGILGEVLIFGPLERRNATPLTLMVGSIGLGMVIRQVIQEIYGALDQNPLEINFPNYFDNIYDTVESIPIVPIFIVIGIITGAFITSRTSKNAIDSGIGAITGGVIGYFAGKLIPTMFTDISEIEFGNEKLVGRITQDQSWAIIVMVFTVIILKLIFTKTTLGISMRATADDAELAQITGINTKRVIFWTWFIAAGVTGMGAIFRFTTSSFLPASGFTLLLIIFAVVILGGFDSFEGTLISAFIVAGVQSMTVIMNEEFSNWSDTNKDIDTLVFWNTSAEWIQVIPFIIIIVILLFRPRGIFGLVDPKSKL